MLEHLEIESMSVSRREFLKYVMAMAASSTAGGALVASEPSVSAGTGISAPQNASISTPNVLFIVNDEERHWSMIENLISSDLLGTTANPAPGTFRREIPARMRLRNNGVRFTNYYTATAPCSPARGVMYTGHHAPDTQVVENMDFEAQESLRADVPTTADVLAAAGYYCAYKGKVHLARDKDLVTAEDMYNLYGFRDWQGPYRLSDSEGPQAGASRDDNIANFAVNWLGTKGKSRNAQGQPWLLAVNFINPHDIMLVDVDGERTVQAKQGVGGFPLSTVPDRHPYYFWWNPGPPTNFVGQNGYTTGSSGPRAQILDEFASLLSAVFGNIPYSSNQKTSIKVYLDNANPQLGIHLISVPLWKAYLNYYLNCIIDNDQAMGKVLQALTDNGMQDDTIIVYTADHGELGMSHMGNSRYYDEASKPGYNPPDPQTHTTMPLRQKGPFVYEENNNVPFVIACLSTDRNSLARQHLPVINKDVRALASSVDILPTLVGWAGKDGSWYEQQFGTILGGLRMRSSLPGVSLHNVAREPDLYQKPKWSDGSNGRQFVLFTADSVSTLDADYAYLVIWNQCEGASLDTTKRGILRGCFDGRYKYARYYSPEEYYLNRSAYADLDYGAIIAAGEHGQDVQLFDLNATPNETFNAAQELSATVTNKMNKLLARAMAKELFAVDRTPKTVKRVIDGTIDACG